MGCDIHLCVEKKVNGKWESVDDWTYNAEDDYLSIDYDNSFYNSRNYDLFAILADVRNGYGFAGCDTGDGFIPISRPRGLPKDISKSVGRYSDRWGLDGHSHSWFTLEEILNWDRWNSITTKRGTMSEDEYLAWDKIGEPESYCGGVGGSKIKTLNEKEYNELMKDGQRVDDKDYDYCIRASWKQSYKDCADSFWTKTIPQLKELDSDPKNIRIVFFFDN